MMAPQMVVPNWVSADISHIQKASICRLANICTAISIRQQTYISITVGHFCGNQFPAPVVSGGSSMVVRFKTDSSQTAKGFSAVYTVTTAPPVTTVSTTTTNTTTTRPTTSIQTSTTAPTGTYGANVTMKLPTYIMDALGLCQNYLCQQSFLPL